MAAPTKPAGVKKVLANSEPSTHGRYCCKSPKLPGANFPPVKKTERRPPIDVASITLPGSPASFSSDDEVPHIFTWKSPVQPKEILIASAKRLLQQNLPGTAVSNRSKRSSPITSSTCVSRMSSDPVRTWPNLVASGYPELMGRLL